MKTIDQLIADIEVSLDSKAESNDRPRLAHDGTPDCPACAEINQLGHKLTQVVNASELDNEDRIEAVLRLLASGFVYSTPPGKELENSSHMIARLSTMIGEALGPERLAAAVEQMMSDEIGPSRKRKSKPIGFDLSMMSMPGKLAN